MGVLGDLERAEVLDPLDRYVEAHVHGGVRVPQDVEAVVVDPSFDDGAATTVADDIGLAVETHPGYAATADQIEAHPGYRGPQVAALARRLVGTAPLTPAGIGAARALDRVEQRELKQLWHCLARYGRAWPSEAVTAWDSP
jgi:hypothetical protein